MNDFDRESLPVVIIAVLGILGAVLIYHHLHQVVATEDLPELTATPIGVVEELSGGHEEIEVEVIDETATLPTHPAKPVLMDEELIAMVVHAEAGNQSMLGKTAVAAVVLNRCDYWNLTVETVVYADNQFAIADSYTKEDMRAVEIAINNRDLFPQNLLYFRAGHFHKFGVEWEQIGDHYFSTKGETKE